MENERQARAALESRNPFRERVVGNGFDEPEDVAEIHAGPRERLRQLVDEVRRDRRPRLQVVVGVPGGGKTHLLANLRGQSGRSWGKPGEAHALVPIRPMGDAAAPFAHLLRETVAGLGRPFDRAVPGQDALASPLDHLIVTGLRRAFAGVPESFAPEVPELRRILNPARVGPHASTIAVELREEWPRFEPLFLEVAPQFNPVASFDLDTWIVLCRSQRAGLHVLSQRWLRGDALSEADLTRLGVARPIETEDGALRALSTLLRLTDVPVVLGLDQLEGVLRHGDSALRQLFQALSSLYTEGGTWGAVLFCQAIIWADVKLEQQIRDRLERPEISLANLTPPLAEKLVAHRLAGAWRGLGVRPPHATWPYPSGFVLGEIERCGLVDPRRVLEYFERLGFDPPPEAVSEPPPPPPRDVRAEARTAFERLRRECEAERKEQGGGELDGAFQGLADLFEQARGRELAGMTVVGAARETLRPGLTKIGLKLRVAHAGREVTIYGEASNAVNGKSASDTAKRLTEALDGHADRAVWWREAGLPIPPKATEILRSAGDRCSIVRLAPGEIASLAAIDRLLDESAAQDLDVPLQLAADVMLEDIAPTLAAVTSLASPGAATPLLLASDPVAFVEAAIATPPFVVTEARLATESKLPPEAIAVAGETLERQGKARRLTDPAGRAVVARRPR